MFYIFSYFYILFTVFCCFLFSLCSVLFLLLFIFLCFIFLCFFPALCFLLFFVFANFIWLDCWVTSLWLFSCSQISLLCSLHVRVCTGYSVLVLLFVLGFVSSFLFCYCCCYYLFISSPFVLSFLWFHHPPYFFFFFCHTVWLARSWLRSQGLSLSLWGESAKPRMLHQQRMPSPREY